MHRMQYINGLHVDGRSTDKTYLPESVLAGGGELAFSLVAEAEQVVGDRCVFGAAVVWCGESGVDGQRVAGFVAVDAGTSTDVTVNVQRMVDGPE